MASKKVSRKPKGMDFANDLAEAIIKAITAGSKASKSVSKKPLGNLSGVERGFAGRPKRVSPPSPPKGLGGNQAAPRPTIPMRPAPPSRPATSARPSVPMRTRPPEPPVKKAQPKPKAVGPKSVKPSGKSKPRRRSRGMR